MKFRFWDFRLQSYTYFDLSSALPIYQDGKEGVVEQFTGLLDDEDREIYAGDIIKIFENGVDTTLVERVKYLVDVGAFDICSWKISEKILNKIYTFKVIGNINENPEIV